MSQQRATTLPGQCTPEQTYRLWWSLGSLALVLSEISLSRSGTLEFPGSRYPSMMSCHAHEIGRLVLLPQSVIIHTTLAVSVSVQVDAAGLESGPQYAFRFQVGRVVSDVGTFR